MASISSLVLTLQAGYGSQSERVISAKEVIGPGHRAEFFFLTIFFLAFLWLMDLYFDMLV